MRRWFMILLMMLVCLAAAAAAQEASVLASDADELQTGHSAGNGRITLHMEADGRIAAGGKVRLLQAAEKGDGPAGYSLCKEFKNCGIDPFRLLELQDEDLADQLAAYAVTLEDAGREEAADADGNICFDDLEAGIYLLIQDRAADGFTRMRPFIIMLRDNEIVEAVPKLTVIGEQESEPSEPTAEETGPEETVPEKEHHDLPVTGQLQWPIPVLIGTGFILLAAGIITHKKKTAGEKNMWK